MGIGSRRSLVKCIWIALQPAALAEAQTIIGYAKWKRKKGLEHRSRFVEWVNMRHLVFQSEETGSNYKARLTSFLLS